MYKKTCTVCGNTFTTRGTRAYYCEECKEDAYRKMAIEKQERFIEMRRQRNAIKRYKKRRQKIAIKELHEINAEAKKRGMTYGQYQALLYQQQNPMPGRARKGKNNGRA